MNLKYFQNKLDWPVYLPLRALYLCNRGTLYVFVCLCLHTCACMWCYRLPGYSWANNRHNLSFLGNTIATFAVNGAAISRRTKRMKSIQYIDTVCVYSICTTSTPGLVYSHMDGTDTWHMFSSNYSLGTWYERFYCFVFNETVVQRNCRDCKNAESKNLLHQLSSATCTDLLLTHFPHLSIMIVLAWPPFAGVSYVVDKKEERKEAGCNCQQMRDLCPRSTSIE